MLTAMIKVTINPREVAYASTGSPQLPARYMACILSNIMIHGVWGYDVYNRPMWVKSQHALL
jgi:hypothetical protein